MTEKKPGSYQYAQPTQNCVEPMSQQSSHLLLYLVFSAPFMGDKIIQYQSIILSIKNKSRLKNKCLPQARSARAFRIKTKCIII